MYRTLFSITCFLFILSFENAFAAEENFLLINGLTNDIMVELGPHINERATPACSFNIALSLMGFDSEILKNEQNPTWPYQEGYDDYLELWKAPHNPHFWMKHSCLWFSKLLASQLGLETIQSYLAAFSYGNEDMSGGVTKAWLTSSLKISPKEQVEFIQKMNQEQLPISSYAIQMTKAILYVEQLAEGWKLYGKTGLGSITDQDGNKVEVGWFVGWVEKDSIFFPFAYNIRDKKLTPGQRVPRVKQLLADYFFQSTEVPKLHNP